MSDKHETKEQLFNRLIEQGLLGGFDWSKAVCDKIYTEISAHAIREHMIKLLGFRSVNCGCCDYSRDGEDQWKEWWSDCCLRKSGKTKAVTNYKTCPLYAEKEKER